MAKLKGGLGRGLESLFEDSAAAFGDAEAGGLKQLSISSIEPDPDQPRKSFDDDSLRELADSIREHGVLQPIVVRSYGVGNYRIIAGERRWRAARLAELQKIPALIREVSAEQSMDMALVENLQREDLDPVEEALGIRELMNRCNLTQEQAAAKLGSSRSALANSLRLLNLPQSALELLKSGKLTTGHAKVILGLKKPELQEIAAKEAAEKDLNVRQTEQLCKLLEKQPRPPKPQPLRPALPTEVELSLREILGNEVAVSYKDGAGTLTVHFYSDDQLKAFANLLGGYDRTGEQG